MNTLTTRVLAAAAALAIAWAVMVANLVHVRGWQDISIGTDQHYAGIYIRPGSIDLYYESAQ